MVRRYGAWNDRGLSFSGEDRETLAPLLARCTRTPRRHVIGGMAPMSRADPGLVRLAEKRTAWNAGFNVRQRAGTKLDGIQTRFDYRCQLRVSITDRTGGNDPD